MNNISTWIKVLAAVVGLLITVTTAIWGVETYLTPRFMHNELRIEVAHTKKQVYIMQLEQQIRRVLERVWMLEDRYGLQCKDCPAEYYREYNKLKYDIDRLNRELERVEKGGG